MADRHSTLLPLAPLALSRGAGVRHGIPRPDVPRGPELDWAQVCRLRCQGDIPPERERGPDTEDSPLCGIAGFFGPPDRPLLERMTAVLTHRGPDDAGFVEENTFSLGHRRLCIIDPSGGHQPMVSRDGRLQLAYNGELYNFRELRGELIGLGHTFRSNSDSEVILEAYAAWGTDAFARFNGMWALALADTRTGRLVLSRDPLGIKPLYYAAAGDRWLFASEIKSLLQDPALRTEPDEQILYEYLAHGLHDHRPETFFAGVWRLPAGNWADVDAGGVHPTRYWEPVVGRGATPDPANFRSRFRAAVERHLVADVPVGTCLSGGLDSSAIVSCMTELLQQHAPDADAMRGRVQTFSAVFAGDPIDERAYIEAEIAATGAASTYIHPKDWDLVRELTTVVWHQDEPMVSTGPYAQWAVLREAARHVRVVLDGQGGDELMAGYVPYHGVYLRQLWRQRRLGTLLAEAWAARDVLWPLIRRQLAGRRRPVSPEALLRPGFRSRVRPPQARPCNDDLKRRLLQDLTRFSLPPLLRYEDRNSMAHSVESRVPWLDRELVATVLDLPDRAIIAAGWNRALLREAFQGTLPEMIRRRRWKVGFTTPESRWLFARRAVFQSLFASPAFQARPYWDGAAIADAFRAAAAGRRDASLFFWRVINVELWLRVFFSGDRPVAPPAEDFTRGGDAWAAAQAGPAALAALTKYHPNRGRHLFARLEGATWMRAPIRTKLVVAHDNLHALVRDALDGAVAPGDTVVIGERIVAIAQGRSYPLDQVHPSPLARLLVRFVQRTPHGIGLGVPETMELAVREAGPLKILWATALAAVARLFGVRGTFYRVVGPVVAAIDGPTPGTIPPYNTHAKLGPSRPDLAARDLALALGPGVEVVIVDANDLGVAIMGHTAGVDPQRIRRLLRDNPMGQGDEQTPVILLRRFEASASGAPQAMAAPGATPSGLL